MDYDDTLHVNSMEMFSSTQVNPTAIDATNTITTSSSDYEEDAWYKYSKKCEWEKHSSGMASKKIHKMGYNGKGLGKNEDGIVEVNPPQKKKDPSIQKLLYILSDSMLNGIDNRYKVIKYCHGGCTIECMHSHLKKLSQ